MRNLVGPFTLAGVVERQWGQMAMIEQHLMSQHDSSTETIWESQHQHSVPVKERMYLLHTTMILPVSLSVMFHFHHLNFYKIC